MNKVDKWITYLPGQGSEEGFIGRTATTVGEDGVPVFLTARHVDHSHLMGLSTPAIKTDKLINFIDIRNL